jgi:hypothetical protein
VAVMGRSVQRFSSDEQLFWTLRNRIGSCMVAHLEVGLAK